MPNRFPSDAYTVVPIAELTRVTTLADQLGAATQRLVTALAEPVPTHQQTSTPTPAAEPAAVKRRATQAESITNREHLYQQIHAAGVRGASTADLAALVGEHSSRVHMHVRTLEVHGRVFRTGNGIVRWYATEHRTSVLNSMRRRVPNHDLTVAEASDILGLSQRTTRDMVDAKQLDGRRVGKATMVHRKGALAYIDTIGT
ncbi:helix-turn-helix domain-containing protein, partial [Nonomuraea candida]|uniref:helix-turn-helix domain-containing protein n=1 Tax=Nonomuraea candida TaxID=359159 RepID=UPI0005BE6203